MQAIRTYYLGPTNHRGSRIKADADRGRFVILPWDHALNSEDNHAAALRALVAKMNELAGGGWEGTWVPGHRADGETVWVNVKFATQEGVTVQ